MNPWHLIKKALEWPVASQQIARRNALVATTALTQRRIERAEVDAFVDAAIARHTARHAVRHTAQAHRAAVQIATA